MPEQHRIAAYFSDEAQREKAESLLERSQVFNGVVQGEATSAVAGELTKQGLVVELLEEPPAPRMYPPPPAPPPPRPDLTLGYQVAGQDFESSDFELERPAAADPPPGPYRVRLDGPINAKQLQAFDALGLELEAFEPPDGYRVVIEAGQFSDVAAIPGVLAVEAYAAEEAVTPELKALLEHADDPALAGSRPDRATFDCFVQSPKQLLELEQWLGDQAGVEIAGSSNQRVRFQAPVEATLLAKITERPEVRKLAPWIEPQL